MAPTKGKTDEVRDFLKALGDKEEEVRSAVLEVAKQNAKRWVGKINLEERVTRSSCFLFSCV